MVSASTSTGTGSSDARAPRIRWGRILIAAILSEVGVIAVLSAVIGAYTFFGPPLTEAESSALGQDIGYYVAPGAGVVTVFLAVLWAARPLTSAFVPHGSLVGIVSVVLTFGFIFTARPEHRLMYVIAFALRILAGYVGGLTAQSRYKAREARPRAVTHSTSSAPKGAR